MDNKEIQKNYLLKEELSTDALKLARAIYNTHIENGYYLDMSIKLKSIYSLLNIKESTDSINYVKSLFIELNEPLCVNNFKYKNKIYPTHFVVFCTYFFTETTVELELNEEYLEVEEKYMLDAFLTN